MSRAAHLINEIEEMMRNFKGVMLPHDKSYFEFCLKNAGINGLTAAKERLEDLIDNPRTSQILVVGGNTYPYKDVLKAMGFKLGKVNSQWVNYSVNYNDETIKAVENLGLFTFKTDSIEGALPKLVEMRKAAQEKQAAAPHNLDGKVLEVTKWYGKIVKDEFGLDVIFRNLKVVKVHRETDKAYQVDFQL
jgi:hypothetical protein